MMRRRLVPVALATALAFSTVAASSALTGGQAPSGAESQDERVAAVNDFLSLLSSEQAASVQLPLDSDWRTKWHYFPSWIYERHGLGLGELSDAQRAGIHRIIGTALSDPGYLKASGIILLDDLERQFALELIAREGERPGFGRREAELSGDVSGVCDLAPGLGGKAELGHGLTNDPVADCFGIGMDLDGGLIIIRYILAAGKKFSIIVGETVFSHEPMLSGFREFGHVSHYFLNPGFVDDQGE